MAALTVVVVSGVMAVSVTTAATLNSTRCSVILKKGPKYAGKLSRESVDHPQN